MDNKNLSIFLLKIVLDVLSRILIFSAWMYSDNDGQFSTKRTVGFFYGTFILLLLFNSIFNKYNDLEPNMNWIGKKLSHIRIAFCFIVILGILLNSLNSVLSFNDLDFTTTLKMKDVGKDVKKNHWHESGFVKQALYFWIIFFINIG